MVNYLHISSYIRKPFLIHDFAPDPIWISLYMRKIQMRKISVCFSLILNHTPSPDKKRKENFFIYKEIQRDRVQSHIWLRASSYMIKYLRISSYIRKPFLIFDFASESHLNFLIYEENFVFFFISAPTSFHQLRHTEPYTDYLSVFLGRLDVALYSNLLELRHSLWRKPETLF